MYCEKCGKEVEVYELYDGTSRCVNCKQKIEFKRFQKNAVNEEQFVLSEIAFHEALQIMSHGTVQQAEDARNKKIPRAVELCKRAALSGHAKALLRLAYYYETGFAEVDKIAAYKTACKYYEMIWKNDFSDKSVSKTYNYLEIVNLRQIAALRHLELLQNVPARLNKNVYDYDKKSAEIIAKGVLKTVPPKNNRSVDGMDDAERIRNILLSSLDSGERSPLFGVFYLDGSTLLAWASAVGGWSDRKKKQTNSQYFAKNGNMLLYIFGDGNDIVRVTDTFNWSDISADSCYVMFFSSKSNRVFASHRRYLEKNGRQAIIELCDVAYQRQRDYVFYPDDVSAFRNRWFETLSHATKDLVNDVIKNS